MKQRKTAQKISFIFAIIFYVCAVLCLAAAIYNGYYYGTENSIFASYAASVFFFITGGIVLQVMGSVSLPDLKVTPNEPGK